MLSERRPTTFSGVACPAFGTHDQIFARISHLHPSYCPAGLSSNLVTVFGDQYKLRDLPSAQFQAPQIDVTSVSLVLVASRVAD